MIERVMAACLGVMFAAVFLSGLLLWATEAPPSPLIPIISVMMLLMLAAVIACFAVAIKGLKP